MSFQYGAFEGVTGIEPERALNIGVGVAQAPLWAAFYASAGFGAAWWWATAWTRTAPAFAFDRLPAPEAPTAVEVYVEALDEAVCDLIETAQEETVAVVEIAEAVEDSVELARDVSIEGLRDAQDQDAVREALRTEAAAAPLAAAASEAAVAEPVVVEPAAELPAEPAKPSKKKAPKAEG